MCAAGIGSICASSHTHTTPFRIFNFDRLQHVRQDADRTKTCKSLRQTLLHFRYRKHRFRSPPLAAMRSACWRVRRPILIARRCFGLS